MATVRCTSGQVREIPGPGYMPELNMEPQLSSAFGWTLSRDCQRRLKLPHKCTHLTR